MGFQHRKYYRSDLAPLQIASLVEGYNNLVLTDEVEQWRLFNFYRVRRPFWVYHPQHPHMPVVIRYPGDGELSAEERHSHYGWIDVIEHNAGGSSLIFTHNFDPPHVMFRLFLWDSLFKWLEEQGGKVWKANLLSDNDNTEMGTPAGATSAGGIPRRRSKKVDPDLEKRRDEEVRLYLNTKKTYQEIAEEVSIGHETVKKDLQARGVTGFRNRKKGTSKG